MSQGSSNDFAQELATTSDRFSDLGERLLGAARQLHSPGAPPPENLVEELNACRRDFHELRDRIKRHAESLRVDSPPDVQLGDIKGVTALLDRVSEAELRQSRNEELRGRAAAVLDRVLRISYAGGTDFAPLRDCQDRARQLRETIVAPSWSEPTPEAQQLADGEHPFAHLVNLLEAHHELNDDHWARLHDSVGESFGKSLAAAAARSKLVLPADETPASPASTSGGRDKPSGRRNLGKATPSSR